MASKCKITPFFKSMGEGKQPKNSCPAPGKCLISAIMYIGAKTFVRTVYGNSNNFEVKVGMNQGSALICWLTYLVACVSIKSLAICDYHGSFVCRIQSCLTMEVVVCR